MAGTDVTIIIKAIDSSSKTIKDVAASLKNLASATVAFNKDAVKSAQESQKLETLRSKTLTENEKRLTMFNKSQAQIATENQKRLTEEQRTLTANNKMQLDAYGGIIKVVGAAAKADEQVAGIRAKNAAQNIKNTQAQEQAVKKLQQAHEQSAKRAQNSQQTTQKAFLQTTPFIQKQIDTIKSMGEQFIVAGAILAGFATIVKKAFDFGEEGAQIARLTATGTKLATSFGVNLSDAVRKIKAASLDTITTQQAILEVNRSLLLGIASDADTMAKLMQIAALRGRAFGLDTTDAFDRITLGIGRLSTRILDDIGIVIDGETAYGNYAKSIGKTADQLTEAQKRIALTNAIIEDGNKLLAQTGGLTDDYASAISRLQTHIEDLSNQMKMEFAPVVASAATAFDGLVFGASELGNALNEHSRDVAKSAKTYEEYLAEINRVTFGLPTFVDSIQNAGQAIKEMTKEVIASHPALKTLLTLLISFGSGEIKGSINSISDALLFLGGVISGNITPKLFQYLKGLDLLNETEFSWFKMIAERTHGEGEFGKRLEENALKIKTYTDALEKLSQIKGVSADLGFETAAQAVVDYNEAIGASPGFLIRLESALGLVDAAIIKFRASLKAATEITSQGGRNITADEFLRAFLPIGTAQYNAKIRELVDQLKADLAEVQRKAAEQIADVNKDFGRKALDDQINLARDLSDLRSDTDDKQEDTAKKHRRKMVDIEEDYQRAISKIMRKFELSRIKALIDLDARALFEAEQQRDDDLKDAADSRDDKKKDEEEDYRDRIKELKKFEEDKRAEILRAYERRQQDALRDLADRIADIKADAAQRKTMLEADFVAQKDKTKAELDKIIAAFQTHYDERAKDMLNFFQTNKNILDSLKKGALDPTDILSQFNQVGGIPFGGLPFTPTEPNQPPPTGTHDCPEGKIWDPDAGHCVWDDRVGLITSGGGGGNTLTGGTPMRGTLTLNVTGNIDSAFGQLLRSAISSTVIDIISD